ncbi:MAG TPA: alpha/beta fold hydrolase [Tetragenococcus sp.]|nr:alpha/beta fold hydrolase [Tetragenococcus sp.]
MKITIRKRKIGTIPLLEVVSIAELHQPLPLIVYYHGWQTAKELVLTQARKLASKGFRVILPDAQNHGERKAAVSQIPSLTFFQSIQSNLFEFDAIIAFFEQLKLINGKIGVGGVSMGGMTTAALLTHHPEIDAAACIMGSPSLLNYRSMLKQSLQERDLKLPADYDDLTSWMKYYDLATYYPQLSHQPILFWHGIYDEKIPFKQTDDFVRSYKNEQIIFHAANEGHLVKVATMDLVAEFFYEKLL